MISAAINKIARDESIRRGLMAGSGDTCGCEFPHISIKGPSTNELLFSSKKHRNPKMAALHRRFFRALMERTTHYEEQMLDALGLPDISSIRRSIILGTVGESGEPWRYNDIMFLRLNAIIKEWIEDLLPVEYIKTEKGITEDVLKIKWIIVRFMMEAFGLEADDQYDAIDSLEDGTVVTVVMADPTKAYFRAMLADAGRRITTELAVSRINKVRDALIDMSLKGKWPIEVGRKLHDLIGEGAAWYWLRIARSEATLAANAAFNEMAAANGTNYEEWDAGPGCCIICAWMDGKVWRTGEGPQPVSSTHPHCVPAGTMIHVASGLKKIEDVKVGDWVLTHRDRYRQVVQLHRHTEKSAEMVSISPCEDPGTELILTANHPILIGKDWVDAGEVKFSDKIKFINKDNMVIDSDILSLIAFSTDEIDLYNLSVAGDESYIADNIVVHNCMCARIATYGRGGHSGELQPRWTRESPYKGDGGRPWSKEELDQMREQLQPTRGGQFPLPPKEE